MRTNAIAVGTDGTGTSHAAVDWAAREADRRGVPLRIIHAFDWEWREARYDLSGEYLDLARKFAEGIVATAEARARQVAPRLTVETETLVGPAAPQLLQAARNADLLVVGSRGRGGFAGLLLGSVSQRVATHGTGPVVVVREHAGDPDGPIVAGVDDSPAGDLVLDAAFGRAAELGCPLVVIHAYLPVYPLWIADPTPPIVETPEQDAAEQAGLAERLAPWRERFPDVPLEARVTHRSAAAALVEASRTARLVVVGSRGHGRVAGSLLGSAGLQLLHHAACPVEIVRSGRPEKGEAA